MKIRWIDSREVKFWLLESFNILGKSFISYYPLCEAVTLIPVLSHIGDCWGKLPKCRP